MSPDPESPPAVTATRDLVVEVFEACLCSTSPGAALGRFLGRKLGPGATVEVRDASLAGTRAAAPGALRQVLETRGDEALPALVVNGRLYTQGWLPNFLEAVNLIVGRPPTEPIVRTPSGGARGTPDACGPDTRC